jgi:hypothetical protein
MCITVVNKKQYKGDGEYIGRPSVLGNQFTHLDHGLAQYKVATREEAVEKYREWLRVEWRKNGAVKKELMRLVAQYQRDRKLTLICWCAPEACHGDVLKDAIEKIVAQQKEQEDALVAEMDSYIERRAEQGREQMHERYYDPRGD